MACGGYGSGGFGSGGFGSGGPGFAVASAAIERRNTVLVTFAGVPAAFDPATVWDALNPLNWTLVDPNPFASVLRLAQYVERVSTSVVRVWFDGPLDAAEYTIVASTLLRSATGVPIASTCRTATFDGVGVFASAEDAGPVARQSPADLFNPQVTTDSPTDLGTFQIDDQGDLAIERGISYLRKRIIRRATTGLGGFFHLPKYGFAEPLKGLITPDVLRRMQSRALTQIRQEPDVVAASVTVSQLANQPATVVLQIKVVDRFGQSDEFTANVSLNA